ncbi:hypothetical protein [Corallococcus carmarthensis]|uniref:Uncharacterized protein n=1 Tax=Corallococcus carmarthensis TaxID=2316728 RepID=A0A3A8KDT3_9BACT|nr:hypothetical protein [Corallococcus carmarthensis]RKG99983.1 hypothetical protein D7X32_24895 [Corallococcus carmarthensis]
MSVEVIRATKDAISTVRRTLGLGSCSAAGSRFEIMRATVWSIAAPGSKAHVNRVLSAALPTWQILSDRATASEETLRGELRGALSTLEDAGDLIELRGGYWVPATARFIELPGGVGYLLVGGVPSALLQLDSDEIQFHGPHRHLAKLPSELASLLPVEDLKSWSRLPEAPLQDWAREVFESHERQPYAPTSADVFEFYLPAKARPEIPQFKRWSEDAGNATGTLLARRRRVYGAREYRLVDLRVGRIVGACELHDIDVRRLMYALDLAGNSPVRARPLRVADQTQWLFTSELPRAEQRALAAFGTLAIPDDRPYERRWTFSRNEGLALDMLRSLGIALGQPPREERR